MAFPFFYDSPLASMLSGGQAGGGDFWSPDDYTGTVPGTVPRHAPPTLAPTSGPEMHQPPQVSSAHQGPWGFLMPSTFNGVPVDEESAHRIRSNALVALGTSLMADPTHPSTALAQGLQGFTGTMQSGYEQQATLAHQHMQDDLALQEAHDRHATLLQESDIRGKVEGRAEAADEASTASQAAARLAASAQVKAIEASAGPDSPEAQQARALLLLGDDVDNKRLADLHDGIIARGHLAGDTALRVRTAADAEAAASLVNTPKLVAAGVMPNPLNADRRAQAQLGISQSELGLSRERLSLEEAKASQEKQLLSNTAFLGQVEKEADRRMSVWRSLATKDVGKPDESILMDPVRFKAWQAAHPGGGMPIKQAPTPEEEEAQRALVEPAAQAAIAARLHAAQSGLLRQPGPIPTPAHGNGFVVGAHNIYDPITGMWHQ